VRRGTAGARGKSLETGELKGHCNGTHYSYSRRTSAGGRAAHVGSQSQLRLRPQRRAGIDPADSADPAVDGVYPARVLKAGGRGV